MVIQIKYIDTHISPKILEAFKANKVLKKRQMPLFQKIRDKAVSENLYYLQYVPEWFVRHDEDDYCYDDELVEWNNGYKKRNAYRSQIDIGLLRVG